MKLSSLFNPTYGILRSVVALLIGLAIVIWPDVAVNASVRVLGALMILIGGVTLGMNYLGKERMGSLFAMSGMIAVVFGVILLVFPDFFVKLQAYLFGVLMLFFSIGQISTLISAGKYTKVKFTFYIIPILLFIGGIVMLMNPFETVKTLFFIFGIALIMYAAFELVAALKFRKIFKAVDDELAIESAKAEAADAVIIDSKVETADVDDDPQVSDDIPGHSSHPDD